MNARRPFSCRWQGRGKGRLQRQICAMSDDDFPGLVQLSRQNVSGLCRDFFLSNGTCGGLGCMTSPEAESLTLTSG